MHGTFNGLPLKKIIALKITNDAPGFTRTTFRVLGGANSKLEDLLHLGAEALLILSSSEVEGRIVAFEGDIHHGYNVTVESKKSK